MKSGKDNLKIKLFYSTPQCYLKAVKDANPTLPTKQDDFFPYSSEPHNFWTGYFTSRPTTKYFERETNGYLQMAKQLQVLAKLHPHNMYVLNELQGAMGIMQHHDAITGTEQQHVAHDYERILNDAIEDSLVIPREAFTKFTQGEGNTTPLLGYQRCPLNESSCAISETSSQFVVTIYNHLCWQVKEPIRIPVVNGSYEVYAPNGKQILSQLVDIPYKIKKIPTRVSQATHEIVFIAHLHPLSYKSFYIKRDLSQIITINIGGQKADVKEKSKEKNKIGAKETTNNRRDEEIIKKIKEKDDDHIYEEFGTMLEVRKRNNEPKKIHSVKEKQSNIQKGNETTEANSGGGINKEDKNDINENGVNKVEKVKRDSPGEVTDGKNIQRPVPLPDDDLFNNDEINRKIEKLQGQSGQLLTMYTDVNDESKPLDDFKSTGAPFMSEYDFESQIYLPAVNFSTQIDANWPVHHNQEDPLNALNIDTQSSTQAEVTLTNNEEANELQHLKDLKDPKLLIDYLLDKEKSSHSVATEKSSGGKLQKFDQSDRKSLRRVMTNTGDGKSDEFIEKSYPDDFVLENKKLKLRANPRGHVFRVTLDDDTEVKFKVKYGFYVSTKSGAYIFKPEFTSPEEIDQKIKLGPKGDVVKEIRIITDYYAFSAIRIYSELGYIENDWLIGPINIQDNRGKEYIVAYATDLAHNGVFYTDSNGRQMLKRKLNFRPQYNITLKDPVAGNYYPIVNKISINDSNVKISVLTDRAEGGSSLEQGQIEIMLHRRLVADDGKGVGEALNETVLDGKGLVVRGRHRIYLSKVSNKEQYIQEKKTVLENDLQPQIFLSRADNLDFDNWVKLKNSFSWGYSLPDGLHLLTLQPWKDDTILIRIENYLELSDRANSTITIDLNSIFKTIKIKSYRETTLAANRWLDDVERWSWNTVPDKTINKMAAENSDTPTTDIEDEEFKIVIEAKEIRTFVAEYDFK